MKIKDLISVISLLREAYALNIRYTEYIKITVKIKNNGDTQTQI